METKIERDRSLKKLHFYIASYNPTDEEKLAMKGAQVELKEKIEMKYRKSVANQNYVFPRKYQNQEQYSNTAQVVDLTQQIYPEDNQQVVDQKPKLKIKLARPKNQNTSNTEQYQTSNSQTFKYESNSYAQTNNCKPLSNNNTAIKDRFKTQYSASKDSHFTNPTHVRMKTEHSSSKENYFTSAIKIIDHDISIHGSLERAASGQRSKSKLNMLTKSYMNLKSSLLNSQKTQPVTCNTIRSNDYKFMPNKNQQKYTTLKPSTLACKSKSKWQQCKSSRLLNNCSSIIQRFNVQKDRYYANENGQYSIQKQNFLINNQKRHIKAK